MLSCSFCGKRQAQVGKLIGGAGGVSICNECVRLCVEILHEEGVEDPSKALEPASVANPLMYRALLNMQSELANMQVGLRRLRRRVDELAENAGKPKV